MNTEGSEIDVQYDHTRREVPLMSISDTPDSGENVIRLYSPTIDREGNPGSQPSPVRPDGMNDHGHHPSNDFMPGDPDGSKYRKVLEAEARSAQLAEGAANTLFWRDVKREADRLEAERSGAVDTWTPVDVEAALDETRQEPEVGRFIENECSNGGGVFYAGKVNTVFGPSESGKSMLALAVAAQEINAGRSVLMVDFEDDVRAIVRRMRDLGVKRQDIVERFIYVRPEAGFDDRAYAGLRSLIEERDYVSMAIIDAATEAMTLDGLSGREENDVAKWQTSFPKRIAALGPAVVVVDHTPQGDGSREIGSQHKKSGVTGVSYRCDSVKQFGIGREGRLRLCVAKDKIGSVRAAALPGKERQDWRGDLVIDGIGRPNNPAVSLWGVDPMKILEANAPKEQTEEEKAGLKAPTEEERARVIEAVRRRPGLSLNALRQVVGGNRERAGAAVEWMRAGGEIRREKDGRGFAYYLSEPETE